MNSPNKKMVKICLASIESFPIQTLGKEYEHFSQACICLQMLIQVSSSNKG